MIKWSLVLFLLSPLASADWHPQFHVESYLQQRGLNQNGFVARDQQYEGFVLLDYNLSWTGEQIFFEAKPQLRGVQSPGVGEGLEPQALSIAPSQRWLRSRRLVSANDENELYFDFDRLNFRYRVDAVELYAGRRPFSLGVLRLFPVWNKLTLPLLFQPGPEWIDNPDGFGGSLQLDALGMRLVNLRDSNLAGDDLTLFEAKYTFGSFELQSLLADWWNRNTAGLTVAMDLWDATWRIETIHFSSDRERQYAAQSQWGAGVERAFGSRWTVAVEYFQQSLCRNKEDGYGVSTLSNLQVLNGCRYVFPYVDVQLNSLWRLGLGAMINVADPSSMAILNLVHSWSDDLNIELKGKWATGSAQTEFGSHRFDMFGLRAGAQSSVYVGLSYTL